MWLLQASQCFFLIVLVFAVLGFMRGWRREVLSLVFTLAAVLIIGLGGGAAVAQAIFVRIPLAFQDPNNLQKPASPNAIEIAVVTVLTLVVIIVLGYFVGNKAFPKPSTPAERIWGVIPGIIAGLAVYSIIGVMAPYLTNGSQGFSFFIPAPSQGVIGNSLLLIFVVLVVVVIIGLITSNAKKSGGGGGKK